MIDAFSKRAEAHYDLVWLYALWCNLVRVHKTLHCSPAMVAGLTDRLSDVVDIVALVDAAAGPTKARGAYKPRQSKDGVISD